MNKELREFISDICSDLSINVPEISFDTSNFTSETMMAQCLSDGSKIYLREKDVLDPDYIFALVHELRHVWQIKNNKEMYFSNYKTIDMLNSVDEYNLQLAELDANAYAGYIMQKCFGLTPLYKGLPEYIKNKIYDMIKTY